MSLILLACCDLCGRSQAVADVASDYSSITRTPDEVATFVSAIGWGVEEVDGATRFFCGCEDLMPWHVRARAFVGLNRELVIAAAIGVLFMTLYVYFEWCGQ